MQEALKTLLAAIKEKNPTAINKAVTAAEPLLIRQTSAGKDPNEVIKEGQEAYSTLLKRMTKEPENFEKINAELLKVGRRVASAQAKLAGRVTARKKKVDAAAA
jgi:hypothetical protein